MDFNAEPAAAMRRNPQAGQTMDWRRELEARVRSYYADLEAKKYESLLTLWA
jgi:hypothetical protein